MSERHRHLAPSAQRLYGSDPAAYAAGRPEYPNRVLELLVDRCGLAEGTRVLEIGPGTGLVTRHLLEHRAHVEAVEPDPSLASYLQATLGGERLHIVRDTFEDADIPGAPFDLAIAATSFHWVDQNVGLPKLGQVVRPRGWVAIWWTLFGDASRPDPFRDATRELMQAAFATDPRWKPTPPAGQSGSMMFELDLEQRQLDLRERAGLEGVEGELVRWTDRLDTAQVRALYASTILVLRLAPDVRERLLDAMAQVADKEFGGVVERPFVTSIFTGQCPAGK